MPTNDQQTIKVSRAPSDQRIGIVTLDRPPVNALDTPSYLALAELFSSIADDPELRCLVLTGAGTRAFCAGSDVREFKQLTPQNSTRRARTIRAAFEAIWKCPLPVLGAVNGPALGAGLAVCSYCDVLIASDTATFGLPEIKVGVLGGTKQLSRLVPPKKLRWMALTGESVTAQELKNLGGVEAVVPAVDLIPTAITYASKIADRSPTAVRLQKEALNLTEYMGLAEGYQVEQAFTGLLSGSSESKEAASSYLEKRDQGRKS
jgi:enoyl-CoA hydratase/carnithine racemase